MFSLGISKRNLSLHRFKKQSAFIQSTTKRAISSAGSEHPGKPGGSAVLKRLFVI